MKIIFSHSISKKEDLTPREKEWLVKGYRKGIFDLIKGKSLPKDSRLAKLYLTTIIGPRRAVFLMDTRSGDGFFLMFRSKNDPVGINMSLKNPVFASTLEKYLILLGEDLDRDNIEILEL